MLRLLRPKTAGVYGDSLWRAAGHMPIFVSNYCTHMCNGVTNCVMQSLTELTGFEVFVVGVGEGRGAGADGGGRVIAGSAACLDGIGRLAALTNDGVDCPYNGNHMYEHIVHL